MQQAGKITVVQAQRPPQNKFGLVGTYYLVGSQHNKGPCGVVIVLIRKVQGRRTGLLPHPFQ